MPIPPSLPRTSRGSLRLLSAGLGLLLLTGVTSCAAPGPAEAIDTPSISGAPAADPIDGVKFYPGLAGEHVTTPVTYEQSPAVGGDHSPAWTNCGIYTRPVEQMRAVHSMEHGAVWITYSPELPAAQIKVLTDLVGTSGYVVLSPYPGQTSPVTATAWGVQLGLDEPTDPRLRAFLTTYVQGEQTPEPGAPCTGAVNG